MKKNQFTCPVCGYQSFSEPPGSDEICEICFWHDDLSQLKFPLSLGANKINLIQAQMNFQEFGASEKRVLDFVRKPNASDLIDIKWRPFDMIIDKIHRTSGNESYLDRQPGVRYDSSVGKLNPAYPKDLTNLYYWK